MANKRKRLHMIGNAHIDPVWLWRWQEGFQEAKATLQSALDRMDEDPDFIFTSGASIVFEWVEENNPAMFERIKQRVAEGRLELVGGWLIQPDCNIPCGESFARQGLMGQRYFDSRFGKMAETGYNVDSFGHHGNIPQILQKSGMKNYVFMRPMEHEKSMPSHVFNWESQDGSSVLCFRIPYRYNSSPDELTESVERIKANLSQDEDELMLFYGVGNHGGGPTKANIKSIHALNDVPGNPELIFSSPGRFFDAMRARDTEFPIHKHDLQHHASGCYAAHSGIKRMNRQSENMLLSAEKLSAIAQSLENLPYPSDFNRAWKNVLFNQFHDILAGTSIQPGYEDASYLHGEALAIAQRNLNAAMQAITWDIDIAQDEAMKPLVVMNPNAWPCKMPVEIESAGLSDAPFALYDAEGNPVDAQLVQSQSVTNRRRLMFVADLPALGYHVYKLYPNREQEQAKPGLCASDFSLENEFLSLKIDYSTGNIISLYDKVAGVETIKDCGATLRVYDDPSDTWSHGVFTLGENPQNMQLVSIKLVENGPIRATIRVKLRFEGSVVTQHIRLYRDLNYVELDTKINWATPQTLLRMCVPVRYDSPVATYEIPFGFIEKPANGEEEPGQSWIDFSTNAHGLSLVTDSKYSYRFDGDEMGVTLLRNVPYAHHDPAVLDSDTEYTYLDEGVQHVKIALMPHAGSWKTSGITKLAGQINAPAIPLFETFHKGTLPMAKSFVSVDTDQVVITAIKVAEDGDALILRAYEALNAPAKAKIKLDFMDRELDLSFTPSEIKTIKIPCDKAAQPKEVNMIEQ